MGDGTLGADARTALDLPGAIVAAAAALAALAARIARGVRTRRDG